MCTSTYKETQIIASQKPRISFWRNSIYVIYFVSTRIEYWICVEYWIEFVFAICIFITRKRENIKLLKKLILSTWRLMIKKVTHSWAAEKVSQWNSHYSSNHCSKSYNFYSVLYSITTINFTPLIFISLICINFSWWTNLNKKNWKGYEANKRTALLPCCSSPGLH